ncbi:hypothetical protein ACFU7Y_17920, partial [Kitasatospora sp. NPDC057542]
PDGPRAGAPACGLCPGLGCALAEARWASAVGPVPAPDVVAAAPGLLAPAGSATPGVGGGSGDGAGAVGDGEAGGGCAAGSEAEGVASGTAATRTSSPDPGPHIARTEASTAPVPTIVAVQALRDRRLGAVAVDHGGGGFAGTGGCQAFCGHCHGPPVGCAVMCSSFQWPPSNLSVLNERADAGT